MQTVPISSRRYRVINTNNSNRKAIMNTWLKRGQWIEYRGALARAPKTNYDRFSI